MGAAPAAAEFAAALPCCARRSKVLQAQRSLAFQSHLTAVAAKAAAGAAVAEALLSFHHSAPLVRRCGASQNSEDSTTPWKRAAALSASAVRARGTTPAGPSRPAGIHARAASSDCTASGLADLTVSCARTRVADALNAATAPAATAATRKASRSARSTTSAALHVRASKTAARPDFPSFANNWCPRLLPLRTYCYTGWHSATRDSSLRGTSSCSSSNTPPVTLRNDSTTAAAVRARFSPAGGYCSGSCLAVQRKVFSSTSSTAAHLQTATAAVSAVRQRSDSVSYNRVSEGCHAGFSVVATDRGGNPGTRRRELRMPVGVLVLRRASDRESFSKRSRRRVPLVFSNEVHSVTFPDSSDIAVGGSSACTDIRTSELVNASASNSGSTKDTADLSCSSGTTSASVCLSSSTPREPASALSSCGSTESSTRRAGGRSAELENSEGEGHGVFDVGDSGSNRCGSEGPGDTKIHAVKKTLQKRSRSQVNGLVYIEDDEGTRYGIGYACPRHPLIAARVLTQDVTEEIGVDFFFRRLQTALRQRQGLQQAFDWLGGPGSIKVSAGNGSWNTRTSNNSGTSSSTKNSSSNGALEGGSSADLIGFTGSSSNKRYGSKRETPADRTRDTAGFTAAADEVAVAPADAGGPTSQATVQEKQLSKDYFRLINSEGDRLPGVVIDLYGKYASIQLLSCGIDFLLPLIVEALQRLLQLRGIVVRLEHPDRLFEHPQQQLEGNRQLGLQQQHSKQRVSHQQQRQQHAFEKPPQGRRDRSAANEEVCVEVNHERDTFSTLKAASPSNYQRYSLGEHFSVPLKFPRHLRCLSFGPVPDSVIIEENGCLFPVDLLRGDGTGWRYDRRELRRRVAFLSTGKRVLDLFCNSGGSAVTAMRLGGARECVGVCTDERALQLARQAISLNDLEYSSSRSNAICGRARCSDTNRNTREGVVTLVQADVFDWLAEVAEKALDNEAERFDLVVLDPPNWAWRSSDLLQQRQRQQELVAHTARLTAERGFLFVTCSSRHYCAAGAQFVADVQAASAAVGKTATLCGEGGSGPDFPTDVSLPRSRELFWVLLQLECR